MIMKYHLSPSDQLQYTVQHSFVLGDYKDLIFNIKRTIYDIIFIFVMCKVCTTVNLLKKSFDLEMTLTL